MYNVPRAIGKIELKIKYSNQLNNFPYLKMDCRNLTAESLDSWRKQSPGKIQESENIQLFQDALS